MPSVVAGGCGETIEARPQIADASSLLALDLFPGFARGAVGDERDEVIETKRRPCDGRAPFRHRCEPVEAVDRGVDGARLHAADRTRRRKGSLRQSLPPPAPAGLEGTLELGASNAEDCSEENRGTERAARLLPVRGEHLPGVPAAETARPVQVAAKADV